MKVKGLYILIGLSTVLLNGCFMKKNEGEYSLPSSPRNNYDISLINYNVNIFGKYRVKHAFLSGTNITPCFVGSPPNDVKIIWRKYDDGDIEPGYISYWKGRETRGPLDLALNGTLETNSSNGKIWHWMSFSKICGSWTPGGAITLGIRNASRQSIAENFEESIGRVARYSHGKLDALKQVMRNGHEWTYVHTFVPIPPGDTSEEWFLPIGDSGYYYRLTFGYNKSAHEANAPSYLFSRRLFDQILDSFVIEKIVPNQS